jgi:hypothetical protein
MRFSSDKQRKAMFANMFSLKSCNNFSLYIKGDEILSDRYPAISFHGGWASPELQKRILNIPEEDELKLLNISGVFNAPSSESFAYYTPFLNEVRFDEKRLKKQEKIADNIVRHELLHAQYDVMHPGEKDYDIEETYANYPHFWEEAVIALDKKIASGKKLTEKERKIYDKYDKVRDMYDYDTAILEETNPDVEILSKYAKED